MKGNNGLLEYIDLFETEDHMLIVTELMDINLKKYVVKHCCLTESVAQDLFVKLAKALQKIHQLDIIHRDLKPENILLKLDNDKNIIDVKISDFGLSCIIGVYSSA